MKRTLNEIEHLYQLFLKSSSQEKIVIGRLFLGFSLLYLNGTALIFELQFKKIQRLLINNHHNKSFFLDEENIEFLVQFLKNYPVYLIRISDDQIIAKLSEIVDIIHNEVLDSDRNRLRSSLNENYVSSNYSINELLDRLEECNNNEYEIAEINERIELIKNENNNDSRIIELNKELDNLKRYDYHSVLKEIERFKYQVSSNVDDRVTGNSFQDCMTLTNYSKLLFKDQRKNMYSLIRQWLVNHKIIINESIDEHYIYTSTSFGREIGVLTKVRVAKNTGKKTTAIYLTKNAQDYISKHFKKVGYD